MGAVKAEENDALLAKQVCQRTKYGMNNNPTLTELKSQLQKQRQEEMMYATDW